MTDIEMITVPHHLRGYPGAAFGGYVAGMLAGRAAAKTVRVDFRRPTPVAVPVGLTGTADGGAVLTGADGVLAVATPDELNLDVPEPPSWDEASTAAEAYRAAPPEGLWTASGVDLTARPTPGCPSTAESCRDGIWWPRRGRPGPRSPTRRGSCGRSWCGGALDCPGNAAGRLRGCGRGR